MNTEDIIRVLDDMLHPELQDSYDNSGTQVIFRGEETDSILISLDPGMAVIDEAVKKKCGIVITHHPLLFRPMGRIDSAESTSSILIKIIDERISVYSAHTNLDRLYNDRLARLLGLIDIEPIRRGEGGGLSDQAYHGVIARLDPPASLPDFIELIKKRLGLEYIIITGESKESIERVAVFNGSGGRNVERIITGGHVDCIITGDVGYHQAKYAEGSGIAVIDAGHFATEIIFPELLRDHIHDTFSRVEALKKINIYVSESEKNPFCVY